jgi:hypothetical protein
MEQRHRDHDRHVENHRLPGKGADRPRAHVDVARLSSHAARHDVVEAYQSTVPAVDYNKIFDESMYIKVDYDDVNYNHDH